MKRFLLGLKKKRPKAQGPEPGVAGPEPEPPKEERTAVGEAVARRLKEMGFQRFSPEEEEGWRLRVEGLADGERVVLERWSSWGWRKEGLERRGEKGFQEDELASVEVSGDELGASHAEVKVGLEAPSGWGPATRLSLAWRYGEWRGASVFLGELPPRFWWGEAGRALERALEVVRGLDLPGLRGFFEGLEGIWILDEAATAPGPRILRRGAFLLLVPAGEPGGLLVFRPQGSVLPPSWEEVALLGPGIHRVEPLPGLELEVEVRGTSLRTKRLRCWGRVGKAPFAGRKTPVEVADWLMPTPEAVARWLAVPEEAVRFLLTGRVEEAGRAVEAGKEPEGGRT